MPVPVIITAQSVLGYLQWQTFTFQPYATNNPTAWESSTLPSGVTCDSATGAVSGAARVPGVYDFALIASNAAGASEPVVFTLGIEPTSDHAPSTLTEVEIDLDTGIVTAKGSAGGKDGVLTYAKRGDDLVFQVTFTKAGVVADLALTALKFALKLYEPEQMLVESDEWAAVGEGQAARYQVHVQLAGTALSAALSDFEEDAGTLFTALAEFEWIETNSFEVGPETLRHTSRTFNMEIVRDLIADA